MRSRAIPLLLAISLLALAYGSYRARKAYIRNVFVPGAGGAPAPRLPAGDGPGLTAAARVRVILLDGVDAATARSLPNYDRVCNDGLDLEVDVGFPTVSLPIQRVLWTGLTQQQTGILFFNKVIAAPPRGVPAQSPGSIAVAESHAMIIHSLGFHVVEPADAKRAPPGWSRKTSWRPWLGDLGAPVEFEARARAAVLGDAPLAFVHVLRTDTIAHVAGRDSHAFRDAAVWADRFVGALYDAERAAHPGTRWFVLADHGHRAGGGHGGAEPWIRTVRACIAGGVEVPASPGRPLHLVDISRALADSVGATLDDRSAGRPLYGALAAAPSPGATLPRVPWSRWLGAAAVLALALALTAWAARGRWLALPWWWPVAYLSLTLIEMPPSLSTHMIYKADGRIIYMAALPGLALLAITCALALRRLPPARAMLAQLALPLGIAIGGLIVTGGVGHLIGHAGEPPLVPRWTANTSVFGVLLASGAVVVALALLATVAPGGSGRRTPRGSAGRAA